MPNWLWVILKIVAGLSVLALLVSGVGFLFAYWPAGKTEAKKLKEVIEAYRNLGLLVAGFFAVWFAWHRSRIMDKDDRRKDKERIEERLEGAVRLLAEPTDSMKNFAITQLEQIATEYPAQTLATVVSCLGGQVKEYDPHFSEKDLQRIEGDAKDEGVKEHRKRIAEVHQDVALGRREQTLRLDRISEKTPENIAIRKRDEENAVNVMLHKAREKRTRAMNKKLVKAINRLLYKADPIDLVPGERAVVDFLVPLDLSGLEIVDMTLNRFPINADLFSGSHFTEVTFSGCSFKGSFDAFTNFLNCHFDDCTFEGVYFDRCGFYVQQQNNSFFVGSSFTNCTFEDTHWETCNLQSAKFQNIKLGCSNVESEEDGLIDKNTDFFVDCDMTNVQFEIGRGKIETHLRWNYQPDDFGTCFVTGKFPVGLDVVRPKIRIEISPENRGRWYFTFVDEESGSANK